MVSDMAHRHSSLFANVCGYIYQASTAATKRPLDPSMDVNFRLRPELPCRGKPDNHTTLESDEVYIGRGNASHAASSRHNPIRFGFL